MWLNRSKFLRFFNRSKNIFFLAGIIATLVLISEALHVSSSASTDDIPFNQNYKVYPVPLPDTMSFAGEKVPMNHLGVREALEQEMLINTYWQSQALLMLKRAHRYFPEIEEILKENSIPDDFKYLALAESAFSYRVSSAGAVGFWQMMKSTAEAYHLEISKDVDERYNLKKSTEAACRYFKDAYQELHNWTLVAASYNMGIAGVERELQYEKENSYYDLSLNQETARYVYRILSLKQFVTYPALYGYYLKKKDYYMPVPSYTVNVDSTITSLGDYAQQQGISYHVLKFLNPWLINEKLINLQGKSYEITLPKKNVQFADLGEFMNYSDSIPCPNQPTAVCAIKRDSLQPHVIMHIVAPGETLDSIARQYNVPVERLRIWNSIPDSVRVKERDEIMIFENQQ
jgi:hypothetical protein